MATCRKCGATLVDSRECSYCEHTYCSDHRLPEKHDCPGVKNWGAEGDRFDSGFDNSE